LKHALKAGLLAGGTLLYPFIVYVGLRHWEPRVLALVLVGLALARALSTRSRAWLLVAGVTAALGTIVALSNQPVPLKLYPVVMNAAMLGMFGASLFRPQTVIERIARLREPNLSEAGVRYTRGVTKLWCGFFVVNGTVALLTAWYAPDRVWALYNGLIAYMLIGALFAGEWLVRRKMRGGGHG
jgi:uncharacterized membrane protein